MKRKSILLISLLITSAVLLSCAFTLTACNKNEEPIPDHSALFTFLASDDKTSYAAVFMPTDNLIIPPKVYVPSEYCGYPITFAEFSEPRASAERLNEIKSVYLPASITGAYIGTPNPITGYTLKNKGVRVVRIAEPGPYGRFSADGIDGRWDSDSYVKTVLKQKPVYCKESLNMIVGYAFICF